MRSWAAVGANRRSADRAFPEDVGFEHDALELTPVDTDDSDSVAPVTTGEPEVGHTERSRRTFARRGTRAFIATALVALSLTWVGWLVSGGGLFWVGSPSMGMVAPVGSLVATQPLAPSSVLRVGEVVVFRPHLGRSSALVHRIHKILPGDRYLTKGDLNQEPDPWVITRGDVVGTPQAIIPAIGWIYKCATWLFLGAAVLMIVAHSVSERQRRWILALGPVVLFGVPILKYRPFIGGFLYGSGQRGRLVSAKVVNTGILPVDYSPALGRAVRAAPGQEVLVTGMTSRHSPILDVRISAGLPWWGWALVILACLTPLILVSLEYRLSRPTGRTASTWQESDPMGSRSDGPSATASQPLANGSAYGRPAQLTMRQRPQPRPLLPMWSGIRPTS